MSNVAAQNVSCVSAYVRVLEERSTLCALGAANIDLNSSKSARNKTAWAPCSSVYNKEINKR